MRFCLFDGQQDSASFRILRGFLSSASTLDMKKPKSVGSDKYVSASRIGDQNLRCQFWCQLVLFLGALQCVQRKRLEGLKRALLYQLSYAPHQFQSNISSARICLAGVSRSPLRWGWDRMRARLDAASNLVTNGP
jgi:hypothetical protein